MGSDSVIYIRTDGNSKIATGHLVRCLCIAQALESLEKSVCFLVSDEDSFSLFPGRNCIFTSTVIRLPDRKLKKSTK